NCDWSPDGELLAFGSKGDESTIFIWHRNEVRPRLLRGHTNSVWDVSFSPDGKTLASGSIDFSIKLWDVATGQVLRNIQADPAGNVSSVEWSPDGKLLATGGSTDHGLKIFDATSGELVYQRPNLDIAEINVA